ncbi:MAG: tetratricopeptide repeat protein [Planctomycetes bacterium]|nr:tetratricopeptide repeat protein [Planctomycetota bacterium]
MDTIATTLGDPSQPCCLDDRAHRGSFLRRWLRILFFSLLIAALAGPVPLFLQSDTYTATALIRVKAKPERLVFETGPPSDEREFERYRDSLQQYFQQRYVLEAAVRQVSVAMKEAKKGDDVTKVRLLDEEIDPAAALGEILRTDCPGGSEILRIRLTRDSPQEAAILLNAVVDAFIEEVVSAESGRVRERLGELDRIYFAMQEELRTLKSTERQLAEHMGSTPSPVQIVNRTIDIERLRILRSRQFEMQYELRSSHRNLKLQQTKLNAAEDLTISETELDARAESDSSACQLILQQNQLQSLIQQSLLSGNANNPVITERLREYETELSSVTRKLAERRGELKQELRRQRRTDIETESTQLQARIVELVEQLGELEADIEKQEECIGQYSLVSLDAEMMRAEIKWKDSAFADIAAERHRVQIELERHQSRITVPQRAVAPKSPDKRAWFRGPALAAAVAFFVAAGMIAAFGSLRRARRSRLAAERLNLQVKKLFEAGRVDEALPLAIRAVRICQRALGSEHPDYATNLDNLALVYQARGEYVKAEPLYFQALDIKRTVLGEEHPDYVLSLNNLANLYETMSEYAKAEPLYMEMLDIEREMLGEDHPDFGASLYKLAELYKMMGDDAKAEALDAQFGDLSRKDLR